MNAVGLLDITGVGARMIGMVGLGDGQAVPTGAYPNTPLAHSSSPQTNQRQRTMSKPLRIW